MDDETLIALLKKGDVDAFKEVHRRYHPVLFRHAYSRLQDADDVQDLLQEIFIFIWNRREDLNFESSLSGYLFTTVRNKIFDIFKHEKVKVDYIDSFQYFIQTGPILPDQILREKELKKLIEKEINSLPLQMQLIFKMSRNENLSHREIAEKLNLSPLTVKKQVTNSLKILRLKFRAYFFFFF